MFGEKTQGAIISLSMFAFARFFKYTDDARPHHKLNDDEEGPKYKRPVLSKAIEKYLKEPGKNIRVHLSKNRGIIAHSCQGLTNWAG